MAKCDYCGTTILWGATRDGDFVFCGSKCHKEGHLLSAIDQVPEDVVRKEVLAVYEGLCPKCSGPGPVDVHTAYEVWSAFIITCWQSCPQISCRGCGNKARAFNAFACMLVGWWALAGLIMTPIQIGRNIAGLFGRTDSGPSPQLVRLVRLQIAARIVESAGAQDPDGESPIC